MRVMTSETRVPGGCLASPIRVRPTANARFDAEPCEFADRLALLCRAQSPATHNDHRAPSGGKLIPKVDGAVANAIVAGSRR